MNSKKFFTCGLCALLLVGCARRPKEETVETTPEPQEQETQTVSADALARLEDAVKALDGANKYIADGVIASEGGMSVTYAFESDGTGNYHETSRADDVLMRERFIMNGEEARTYIWEDGEWSYKELAEENPFLLVAKTMYDEIDLLKIVEDGEYYLYQAFVGPDAYEHFADIAKWHADATANEEKIEIDFVVDKADGHPISMTSRSEAVDKQTFTVIFNEYTGEDIVLPAETADAKLYVEPVEDEAEEEMVTGGWTAAEDGAITDEIAEMVAKATEGLEETYEPKELLETQVVAGMNYRILCDKIVEGAEPEEVTLTIYKDLEGNVQILDDPEAVQEQAKVEEAAEAADEPVESAEPTAEAGN